MFATKRRCEDKYIVKEVEGKWHTVPHIIVDENFFHERSQRKLEGIINYILIRHEGNIEKFSVSVEKVKDCYNMKLWIWSLLQKSIKELSLIIRRGQHNEVPSDLFSCQQLRKLSLCHFEVKQAHSFKGFHNLISLKLNKVNIATAIFESLISRCPLLEQLTVRNLSCIDHLHINVPKLNSRIFEVTRMSGELKSITTFSEPQPVMHCKHGLCAELDTSWTTDDPGRRFWRCQMWQRGDCGFFQWFDPEIVGRPKELINRLRSQKKALENRLKSQEAENWVISTRACELEQKLIDANAKIKSLSIMNDVLTEKLKVVTDEQAKSDNHILELVTSNAKLTEQLV
ncbi:hypothetical protein GH714_001288 [Hevea brasiliensis]|uniref:GRF-type domain-containing protein n=1 Tax=Hevea brasiliensis TaxID=3981 RepID=A0A6A6KFK3_HEVBR|nr:hypothetical protein GH714_001288 [Hevea brasiliensis]